MTMVAKKYGSDKYIKFEHRVVGALWHADTAKWKLQIRRGENEDDLLEDEVDVFINAGGLLKYFPPLLEMWVLTEVIGNGLIFLD